MPMNGQLFFFLVQLKTYFEFLKAIVEKIYVKFHLFLDVST